LRDSGGSEPEVSRDQNGRAHADIQAAHQGAPVLGFSLVPQLLEVRTSRGSTAAPAKPYDWMKPAEKMRELLDHTA
jgi:hypothetical protein